MEQLSVASMNQLYLGKPGVNGSRGGRGRPRLCGTASSVRCGAFRKTSFTRLVIFHHPLIVPPPVSLSLTLSLPLPWALSSLRPRPFLMPREHNTSKQQHAPSHRHRLLKADAETGQDTEDTHTIRKLKGFSYLICIVIALSATADPLV